MPAGELCDQTEFCGAAAVERAGFDDRARDIRAEIQDRARDDEQLVFGVRAVDVIRNFIERTDEPEALAECCR